MDKKPRRLHDLSDDEIAGIAKQAQESLNEFFTQFFSTISEGLESISNVVESQAELVAPILRKAKMWYFPSMPIDIAGSLMRLAEQENNVETQQVEQVFIDFYDQNNCENLRDMVMSWFDTPIFERRRYIIEDALNAHISSKYTLSIPVLLTQVEGALRDIPGASVGSAGQLLEHVVKQGYIDAKAYNSLTDDILLALAADPFLFNKKRIPDEFFTTEKISEWMKLHDIEIIPLNRNAILHGIQIDYGTKANSLRVFFLLDSIYWIASEKMKLIMNKL